MTKFGPIGREVFERTYQRDGATWEETVRRVVLGNHDLIPVSARGYQSGTTGVDFIEAIESFKMIPGGRHLWVTGVSGRQFLFNCHRAGWTSNPADHFCFVFDELMKGGGVGANYSNEYLEQIILFYACGPIMFHCNPNHPNYTEVDPGIKRPGGDWFHVPDSREGWVKALRLVIKHFLNGGSDRSLIIDVSEVRPRGAPIRGFGGTACGPGPLVQMLRKVESILRSRVGRKFRSLDTMKIDHAIASCVIAGNVRRSARMSMKHWRDPDIFDFINCKADTGSHWTTNISVEVDDEFWEQETAHAMNVLDAVADGMLRNGEPGLFNSSRASVGELEEVRCTNPCGEIALEEWENCNLGNLNLAYLTDRDELHKCARMMTRFLIRATFSDSITDDKQRAVLARNRRIGVGLMGFQEWVILRHGLKLSDLSWPDLAQQVRFELRELYQVIRDEADRYSRHLGIPAPIKVTCVAPTGTVSQLAGVTPGIHPVYAKYFERRVRYSKDDPLLAQFEPFRVTDDIYSANTAVVSFLCRDQIFDLIPEEKHHLIESANELSLLQHLAVVDLVQSEYADNAVSYTANFEPLGIDGDLETVKEALDVFGPYLKGVTLMPDGSRPQAPFQRLTEQEYLMHPLLYPAGTAPSFDECLTGACPIR